MLFSSGGAVPLGRPSNIGDGIGMRRHETGVHVRFALFAKTWQEREALLMKKRGPERGTAMLETAPIVEEDATPVAPDRSGWTPHPSERRDFWHRIRVFPPEVVRWRKRLIKDLAESPGRFTLATGAGPDLQDKLDTGISHLREIARILAILYGTPDLGNKADPVDELVYIILSRKTPERAYKQGFEALKNRFRSWDELLDARPCVVEKLVFSGGLSNKKVTSLYGALAKIREAFGSCTLEPAARLAG